MTGSVTKLIADHMETGFLENIIDMFRHDKSLFPLIGEVLGDERSRVRLGVVALVETLMHEFPEETASAVPGIVKTLKDPHPTIRGDAAYLLGIIGSRDALPFLKEALQDENALVRETAAESIAAINKS